MSERKHLFETSVSIFAAFRMLIAVTAALLIATLIASSAAHGLTLGDAVAQSALGSPLRVVIPISAAPDVSLRQSCFRVVPATGDGSAPVVTARVSLQRAASATRLVVTTQNAVNEPAIRFGIQAECDGVSRRVYVLLLDPPETGSVTATAALHAAPRELKPERPPTHAATSRRFTGPTSTAATQVAHLPDPAEQQASPTPTASLALAAPAQERAPAPDRVAAAGVMMSAAFRPVASPPALAVATGASSSTQPAGLSGISLWTLVAAALGLLGLIAALATLFAQRHAQPEVPQWTRGLYASGPRSLADLSTAPVTVPNTLSFVVAKPQSASSRPQREQRQSAAVAPRGNEVSTPQPRRAVDPSTIDTLLDEVDADMVEERAVREAWAAARSDVEREMDGNAGEMDGNAILQAIAAAERDLHLAPPEHTQSAIERALDDDLLQPQRH